MRIGVLTSVGETLDAFFPPLIERWQELGHEVVTAASTPAANAGHSIIGSVTRRPSPRNLRAPWEIAAWASAEHVDVVLTNTATASFLARVRRLPVPVIYFCHGLHWNESQGFSNRTWQALERIALRNTDAVVVINDDDEDWFRRRKDAVPVQRLSAGVGVPLRDFPRSPIPAIGDSVELLWAGEFSERKRPWLAIDVVRGLLAANVPVHLTMCGDGPLLGRTRDLAHQLGVTDAVSLVGSKSDIADYLTASHGLLMTSTWEGLPRIGLESIAVGRPVFAFDVKGTRSLPDVILAAEPSVDDLVHVIAEHVNGRSVDVDFVEPSELHAYRAADDIVALAERRVEASRGRREFGRRGTGQR